MQVHLRARCGTAEEAEKLLAEVGDPMEALNLVGQYVIGAHCKDGDYPREPGTLGEEYPLGQGAVGGKCLPAL